MSDNFKKVNSIPTSLVRILTPFFLALFVVIAMRLIVGLDVTNQGEDVPWGLWKAYNTVIGTALGASGYALAMLVYLFNKGKYHSLVRTAILITAFGYSFAGLSIIFDLSRWWMFWNLLLPWKWGHTSVLLEVALCIMTYTIVAYLELMPAIKDWAKERGVFQGFVNWADSNPDRFNKTLLFVIGFGILLPTMHQSSLGTMMVIAGHKLHPLWQSMFLPLLFIVSTIFMGYGVLVSENFASSYVLNRPYRTKMMLNLKPIISNLAILWVILRFVSLLNEGKIGIMFNSGVYSVDFFIEVALIVIAIYIMKFTSCDKPFPLLVSGLLLLVGGSLYRLNSWLIAYNYNENEGYFPSAVETIGTIAMIAGVFLVYLLAVKYIPMLSDDHEESH